VRKMQAVYRGHRGRLATYIVFMQYREKKQREIDAAMTIQRFWKTALENSEALKQSAANLVLLVGQARMYTQYFDDSVGKMFYHNSMNDKSLWEPPATGYISTDGVYVLADGKELKPSASARLAKEAWKKFYDEDSEKPYWFNPVTGVTAWSNPCPDIDMPFSDPSEKEPTGDNDTSSVSHPSPIWHEQFDEETQQPYWATDDGETTWENPYA